MIGRRPRTLRSVPYESGLLQLTVPATSRLRIESEGCRPVEKSVFLDNPDLLNLILNLRAEDLTAWDTFERIRSLLGEVHLSVALMPD